MAHCEIASGFTSRTGAGEDDRMKATKPRTQAPAQPNKGREPLRVRTGLKAGDVYMHNPRGG